MYKDPPAPIDRFVLRLAKLSPLGKEARDALQNLRGKVIQASAGTDLVSPGARADGIHLIVEGLAGRFAQFSDGRRQITAIHLPGDVPDLHAVAVPIARPSLQALITTTVIKYPVEDLAALARRYPAVGEAFWAYGALDAVVLERWAGNLGRRSAVQRMAHLLCELSLRLADAGRGQRHAFSLPVTQQQLGDMLGLTPVHVNRTLKALRDQNVVTAKGRQFLVHDWESLAATADFDPSYLLLEAAEPAANQRRPAAA